MPMNFDLGRIPSQAGRVAVVTGANAGIGKETVIGLAKTGMTVVMACRNNARAEAAKSEILATVPNADLTIIPIDLADLRSVRQFAADMRTAHPRLDLLVNNAGVMFPPEARTEDGFEIQMAANYFGHFALTALLLDTMPDTSESRVVTLSSIAHKRARIDLDELRATGGRGGPRAYGQSKLACLMFSLELNRRLRRAGRSVLSVAVHPGVSETELGRHINRPLYLLLKLFVVPFVTHPPPAGAASTLVAGLGPDVGGGDYFGPQDFGEMRGRTGLAKIMPHAMDEVTAQHLWTISEELTACPFML